MGKTPITYYGGKQQLAKRIISLIPEHKIYCEPFCGGAAVFWAKPPSPCEILNDTNKELINFFEVVKTEFSALEQEIRISLHSRERFKDAQAIYARPNLHSRVKRAWAVWMLASTGFAGILDGSFGYDRSGRTSRKIRNKRDNFTEAYAIRLQDVQLEATDALRVIRSRDTAEAFHYVDPPYFNSDCGHYDGYSEADFVELMELLAKIEGKFLMSSYPSAVLKEHTKANGWHQIEIEMGMSISKTQRKVEVLTTNYPIELKV